MQVREVWHILLLLVYISSNLSQHSPHILARHPQESLESRPVIISTQLRSVILVVVSLLSPPPDLDQAGPPGDLIHHRLSQPASQPDCDPSLAWCSQQSRPRPLSLSLRATIFGGIQLLSQHHRSCIMGRRGRTTHCHTVLSILRG